MQTFQTHLTEKQLLQADPPIKHIYGDGTCLLENFP